MSDNLWQVRYNFGKGKNKVSGVHGYCKTRAAARKWVKEVQSKNLGVKFTVKRDYSE